MAQWQARARRPPARVTRGRAAISGQSDRSAVQHSAVNAFKHAPRDTKRSIRPLPGRASEIPEPQHALFVSEDPPNALRVQVPPPGNLLRGVVRFIRLDKGHTGIFPRTGHNAVRIGPKARGGYLKIFCGMELRRRTEAFQHLDRVVRRRFWDETQSRRA